MPRKDILERANQYLVIKIIVNAILMILGSAVISAFLHQMQHKTAFYKQQKNSEASVNEVITTLKSNQKEAKNLTKIFHNSNQETLEDLKELFYTGERFDPSNEKSVDKRSEIFADVIERAGVDYLYVIDVQGNILMAPSSEYTNVNLVSKGLLSEDNLNSLVAGTCDTEGNITPVQEENSTGSYYFYSSLLAVGDTTYYLVLGADESMLTVQIDALDDISAVLKNASVTNGGFMFAVDTESESYLYYEHGDDVLTGTSIADSGLTNECLTDGFSGTQTINGVSYYCYSRKYNNKTIICAVANEENILNSEKYVLFWSDIGYLIVMILCLNYAVIVRNDFVKRKVETKRKYFGKNNSLILDLTILKKVMPLLLTGIIVVFFVSFYTQTLLEISNAISKSETALEEVSSRYAESVDNRELITQYYSNHYLSKAKLLAYIFEEDPSFLNGTTENQYSEYDANGKKNYITDNEGNVLTSVANSERLTELCECNELESINVFNDMGYSIATSTDCWYYALSTDSEDASFVFRDVLDGKKDYYIQEATKDDSGVQSQYIATKFNYYTTVNDAGKTVYVSRFDYEKYQAGKKTSYSSPITKHRAMIQIGLKPKITEMMLESTDVGTIFSTDLLDDGFIVLLNNDKDHTVVYSPNEESIGKSAKEIGFTPQKYGDVYYGFEKVNGISYFNNMKFNENYYIVTAIPQSAMYESRFIIAFFTALVSMFIIVILLMTIAFTTEDEERLYQAASAGQEELNLNASIFRIILPTGKDVTTISATARWDSKGLPWHAKTPEQKLVTIIEGFAAVVIVLIIVALTWASNLFSKTSIILYIISGNWDRGLNIFAFTACALVFIMTLIGIKLVRVPVVLVTSFLGTRSETIGHLILSVAKYGGVLASLFYCLYLIGLDSSSLLASAGILSLVVGLGAQSLIKDIIAGIFIVFEGEFRVGDIVTISDFRGQVIDIGLRTTKILNIEGNTKIYNNSDISGILNMTKAASLAICIIGIEYGQDINYVERVLKEQLPEIKKKCPLILDGPYYKGVLELSESSVNLKIVAYCLENDILDVRYALNRGVLDIFYRNHINIPFNTVTIVHEEDKPDDQTDEKKKTTDLFDEIL